jgi:hypothetical protein
VTFPSIRSRGSGRDPDGLAGRQRERAVRMLAGAATETEISGLRGPSYAAAMRTYLAVAIGSCHRTTKVEAQAATLEERLTRAALPWWPHSVTPSGLADRSFDHSGSPMATYGRWRLD